MDNSRITIINLYIDNFLIIISLIRRVKIVKKIFNKNYNIKNLNEAKIIIN